IFLFVMTALSTWFVYRYADKIQKDPTKSLVYSTREEDLKHFNVETSSSVESTLSKKQRIVLVLFILTFVLMVLSFIPWTDLGITIFKDVNTWLTGLPVLGKIIGSSTSALGTWYFPEG
ncbi:YfcC family protein, partial [Streptococcus pneumoniae]|nr:YfcC family protein [Streptococcus pneumoniae]